MAKVSEKTKREAYVALILNSFDVLNTEKVVEGIQFLGGVCDGARSWDGAGFGKFEVDFGQSLANKAAEGLSKRQLAYAAWFCTKYHKQLEAAGIIESTMDLLVPAPAPAPAPAPRMANTPKLSCLCSFCFEGDWDRCPNK